jgi:drug/metabolite transporter (DMT)-like permease
MPESTVKAKVPGWRGFAYIACATILFSSMEVALKSISGRFNALQLNFLRFALGGAFLLPFALGSLRKRRARLALGDLGFFASSGLVCVVGSMTMFQLAIQYCPASIVALLFSCNPVFLIPLAAIFLGERIRGRSIASLALSLAGMAAIMSAYASSRSGGQSRALGLALTVGSAFAFAVYGAMCKPRSRRLGGLATTALSFLAGSAELLAIILATKIPSIARAMGAAGLGAFADVPILAGLEPSVLPIFAYISLCVTGLGYAAYFMAIEESSAATASIVFYLKPAIAPLFALAFLGERIGAATVGGIVLIAAGSTLSFLGSRGKG